MVAKKLNIYRQLFREADIFPLTSLRVDRTQFLEDLQACQDSWIQYNPRKTVPRFGLSLTSLDGAVTGIPDLDSIREYNILNNTKYKELDFSTMTSHCEALKSLGHILQGFEGFLGRSHLLRLDRGGFFSPHRDNYGSHLSAIRVLCFLENSWPDNFFFVYDGQLVQLEPYVPYVVNPVKAHSVFSYSANTFQLVLNVKVCPEVEEIISRVL